MKQSEWTLKALCMKAGVSPRTVRYYIQQGLLPPPDRAGPGATYSLGQLERLQLILRLKAEHLPLAEIRNRISALSDAQVAQMLVTTSEGSPESAAEYVRSVLGGNRFLESSPSPRNVNAQTSVHPRDSSQSPRRSTWERHNLTEDIELHIRRPLSRSQDKQVRRLLEMARTLLSKDSE